MKDNKNKQTYYDLAKSTVNSNRTIYMVLLVLISVLELIMTARALLFFNFEQWYRVVYLVSYLLLFSASAVTLILLLIGKKKNSLYPHIIRTIDIYSTVIILWSAIITLLDVTNGKTMIVFMTVIMCVAAIMNIRPLVYVATVLPLSAALMCVAVFINSPLVATNAGYIINFSVFILFACILAVIKYKLTMQAFLTNKKLERLSYYDQLTGVYNRHSLKEHATALSKTELFYFGIIDVDNFKYINDTNGHDIGDLCLKDIANLLLQHFGDHIYRYGGDEFIVISSLREEGITDAITAINNTLNTQHEGLDLHVSAGFYCPVSASEEYDDYFKKADHALYQAKTTGKNRVVIY